MPSFVHPTAVVDDPCEIGEGTHVWHFSHVRARCTIGRAVNIGQNAYIGAACRIGDAVKIQNNVSVYEGVELEAEVFCGPSCVFTNVINPRAAIERKDEFRPTIVRRGATLGANSTILCGLEIGRWAMVGAGAVVTKSVPDFALMVGNPARRRGWACHCGVTLKGMGARLKCEACGARYEERDSALFLLTPEPALKVAPA